MSKQMTPELRLTIVEHLEELRDRLIVVAIALVVSTAFAFFFAEQLLKILTGPVPESLLIAIGPTEGIVVYMKVALIAGLALAMPVIIYEIVMYLLPALTTKEKTYLFFLVPGASLSFVGGLAFAMFLTLPAAVKFLHGFINTIVENKWTIENYVNFATTVMFWMGIIFELPLIMFFLGKLKIVTVKKLTGVFRYWIVISSVIAAVVTPTPDPINMMIVMIPLVLLYGVGIILVKFAGG
jgi:sec-independent protein translocase protein TatC